VLKQIAVLLALAAMSNMVGADEASNRVDETMPIKRIGVYVLPYYQSAPAPDGRPIVDVAKAFNTQLASNDKEDILAVRDAIQFQPQLITPMTMMVLAIRLYDVGLRDDSVFWFYVAKNRYITLSDVLNVNWRGLSQVGEAVKGFATLAGPFINSYAFCDSAKQRDATLRAIALTCPGIFGPVET
jgi:hypothetical protein